MVNCIIDFFAVYIEQFEFWGEFYYYLIDQKRR